MPAYIVARIDVKDPERLKEYQATVPPIISQYGGKFISRGSPVVTLEGPAEQRRIVLIEFPDIQAAEAFFNSEEYIQARKLREGAAIAEFIAIEGIRA